MAQHVSAGRSLAGGRAEGILALSNPSQPALAPNIIGFASRIWMEITHTAREAPPWQAGIQIMEGEGDGVGAGVGESDAVASGDVEVEVAAAAHINTVDMGRRHSYLIPARCSLPISQRKGNTICPNSLPASYPEHSTPGHCCAASQC